MVRMALSAILVASLVVAFVSYFGTPPTVAQTPPTPGAAVYVYDSIGRVVGETHPASSATYDYDAAENRVSAAQF
jgi:YD repeat-containing protein